MQLYFVFLTGLVTVKMKFILVFGITLKLAFVLPLPLNKPPNDRRILCHYIFDIE